MLKFLETPITIIHVFACFLLILVILIQPGKSGGLGAAFGGAGAQQVFGGRGAGNLLTRVSWITMGVFFATSISLAYMSSSGDTSLESKSVAVDAPKDEKKDEKKSDGEKPAEKKSVDEKPADEKPADEKPADEKPAE